MPNPRRDLSGRSSRLFYESDLIWEKLTFNIPPVGDDRQRLLRREWLVANGLGGYASGTLGGVDTRRYHGLLVAALPAPFGRWVMLNYLEEFLDLPGGRRVRLDVHGAGDQAPSTDGSNHLYEFHLEGGLPVWRYRVGEIRFEKRLILPHKQNTVIVDYRLLHGPKATLRLRPWVHFRSQNDPVGPLDHADYQWRQVEKGHELSLPSRKGLPPLRLKVEPDNVPFQVDSQEREDMIYPAEEERGSSSKGGAWSPGAYRLELATEKPAFLAASTEDWEVMTALSPRAALDAEMLRRQNLLEVAGSFAQEGPAALLVLAADQFLITPAGRSIDVARAHAVGNEVRTVVAGYHWFGDWGRDTMISLEGLTLLTRRQVNAGYVLRTFGQYARDGLIPNLFPEGEREGRYNTADATLWFFHAVDRYVSLTGDRITLHWLLPTLHDCIRHHLRGTKFNIGVDPSDGLLHQGQEGLQLTWMDAKVGDWVVTPRRGKAVEINALWYNALRLLVRWLRKWNDNEGAEEMAGHVRKAREAFNRRFWYDKGGCLYDVIDGPDGDDPSCRPNQIFSFSLRYPVLRKKRWQAVLEVVREKLLTPRGLRSLASDDPEFKPQYFGDRRHRDAAYHQGTVWPWLIGPFIDAWLRVHPGEQAAARKFLDGVLESLHDGCVGSINEIFDAEPPYTPRGCIAQAWSVAEALRAWVRTARRGVHT